MRRAAFIAARNWRADHLPNNLVDAVIAIEDRRFFEHGGIDPRGIMRAAWRNLTGSRGTEGGSTITQQLARLTYLSPERTLRRKVQEVMLAFWLESRLSKKEILANYLNAAYFGAGAFGAMPPLKRYFGKKAADLDVAEAAMLAGLIRAPSHLVAEPQSQSRAHGEWICAGGDGRDRRASIKRKADGGANPSAAARDAAGDRTRRQLFPRYGRSRGQAAGRRAAARPHGHDDVRSEPAGRRRAGRQALAGRGGRAAACRPGGADRDGAGRRDPGDGRRPRLRREPVQPRDPGASPAGLAVQDRSSI